MLNDGDKGVIVQRDKETYAVAPHIPCGLVTPELLRKIADVAEKHEIQALKITSAARIALVGIAEDKIDAVWEDLGMAAGAAVGLCVRSVKACPGTTFCKKGKQNSLALGLKLDEIYHGMELPGKMKMGVSGCPLECAETCIKDIAVVGRPKGWTLRVGGNGGARPRFSQEIATELNEEEVLALIAKIIDWFKTNAGKHQRLGALIEKLGGLEEFKKTVNI